jgi:hypothetical protein
MARQDTRLRRTSFWITLRMKIRDMKHLGNHMGFHHWIIAASALCIASLPHSAIAGAAPEDAISQLNKRGYSEVEVEPSEEPGYQAWGCKSGTRFAIVMDADSNIVDVDPVGSCGAGPNRVASGDDDVHVRVPFADLRVGKGRVRIRAPFVNLDIR